MAVLPFLIMETLQAARLRELTQGGQNQLDPRLIEGGPYKGKWALPKRVAQDPVYVDHYDAFALLTEVALDTELAWPSPPEE